MHIFADTSDPAVVKELFSRGMIDGVTTNPSTASEYLCRHTGMKMKDLAYKLADVTNAPISIEAVGCAHPYDLANIRTQRLFDEAAEIIRWNENFGYNAFWQKIPTIPAGVEAIYLLVKEFGERALINATLGFDYMQGIRAAEAGAHVFSLFMGRMQKAAPEIGYEGEDAVSVAGKIVGEYERRELKTGFLAASMRNPELIIASWRAGADIATMPPHVIEQLAEQYSAEFGMMKHSHRQARSRASNFLPEFADSEFRHPLLKPGLERFVADAASAGYDMLK